MKSKLFLVFVVYNFYTPKAILLLIEQIVIINSEIYLYV